MLTIPNIEWERFLLQIWSLTWKPHLEPEEPVLIVWTNKKIFTSNWAQILFLPVWDTEIWNTKITYESPKNKKHTLYI